MTTQHWDPDTYARNARFVSDLGAGVFALLAPQPGERVLDLGCGDGALTEKLVASGCRVTAVDSSAKQIGAARARGLDARRARAETLPFQEEFDAVFSNAVLHWIPDARAVIACVHRALKPGGRFVAELGGAGCVETVRLALIAAAGRRGLDGAALDPWFFPTGEAYRALLEAQGFVVRTIELFPRPTLLPGDITDWLETFAQPFLGAVAPGDRAGFIQEVRAAVAPALLDPIHGWTADYIRLRFDAHKAH
ncbi:MAG: Methyltransferase type 11 [Acidobacteria bacterium]|nr:Methyltransferase type 11 [Acidobacteriota bacterium]